jgi:hypothetical protein
MMDVARTDAEIKELAEHYARACKGDKARALLMALDAGYDLTAIITAMGKEQGVRAAFRCVSLGWIDRGTITELGRAQLRKGAES